MSMDENSMSRIVLDVASLMNDVAEEAQKWSDKESADDLIETAFEYLNETFERGQFSDEQWRRLEETAVSQYVLAMLSIRRKSE